MGKCKVGQTKFYILGINLLRLFELHMIALMDGVLANVIKVGKQRYVSLHLSTDISKQYKQWFLLLTTELFEGVFVYELASKEVLCIQD